MELYEKRIKENQIYNGKIFEVYSDTVELPDGKTAKRDWVKHYGGAGILVLDKENNVYLVEQYRYAVNKIILEIPAGKIDRGETPYQAAIRELEEELGFKATELTPLGEILPTVGYVSERIYIYLATDYEVTKQKLDEGEFVNIVKMPITELIDRIKCGDIEDAKTLCAIAKYLLLKE